MRPAVVGNAVHDVAAAEALRVLKRCGVQHLAALQVGEVQRDRGCSGVDGEAVHCPSVGIHATVLEVDAIAAARGGRFSVDGAAHSGGEDTRLPAQQRELDVGIRVDDRGLARQAVAAAQERLLRRESRQRLHAVPHLDDALVALTVSAA